MEITWEEKIKKQAYDDIKIEKNVFVEPGTFRPLIKVTLTLSMEALQDLRAAGEPDEVVHAYIVKKFEEVLAS